MLRKVGVIVLLAGVALLPAACGDSGSHTASTQAPAPPSAKNSAGTWVTQAITEVTPTGDDIELQKTKFVKQYEGGDYSYITLCRENDAPDLVEPNVTKSFCYGSYHEGFALNHNDTGFYMYYDILVQRKGAWRPSGYYADMATKVVRIGDRRIECTIKESGNTAPAVGAPFRCNRWWTGDGADSHPHFEVVANPVKVIDAKDSSQVQQAASLIKDNCDRFDNLRCAWTRTAKSTAFAPSKSPADQAQWIPLTSEFDSCPPTDPHDLSKLSFEKTVGIGWSDEFGVKVTAEAEAKIPLVAKVKAGIETEYSHSVEQHIEEKESYEYTVPYNYRSALFMLHGFLTVTGDFDIITQGGDRYLVKNATFQFPLSQDVQIEGNRGQTVKRAVVIHDDKICDNANLPHGAQPTQKIGVVQPAD